MPEAVRLAGRSGNRVGGKVCLQPYYQSSLVYELDKKCSLRWCVDPNELTFKYNMHGKHDASNCLRCLLHSFSFKMKGRQLICIWFEFLARDLTLLWPHSGVDRKKSHTIQNCSRFQSWCKDPWDEWSVFQIVSCFAISTLHGYPKPKRTQRVCYLKHHCCRFKLAIREQESHGIEMSGPKMSRCVLIA